MTRSFPPRAILLFTTVASLFLSVTSTTPHSTTPLTTSLLPRRPFAMTPPPPPPRRSPRLLNKTPSKNSPVEASLENANHSTCKKCPFACLSCLSPLPPCLKLLIGAGGIYTSFLYYGLLQEDVFQFLSPSGQPFNYAWFLQILETLTNVVLASLALCITGFVPPRSIPMKMMGISGISQVTSKACTSLALANGLSFPVATLAKSGKLAPVMAGSLILGGSRYSLREYLQVIAIIGGTAIVSMGSKSGSSTSTKLGIAYIFGSLVMDGITAGFQKRLKKETTERGVSVKGYDYMVWTNVYMCLTAIVIGSVLGEIGEGVSYCLANPEILEKIIKFSLCSAFGQSFIFYTISNFDPLVLSTLTTTRKLFSVLVSIVVKGHALSMRGWSGILVSSVGVMSELIVKFGGAKIVKKS